MLINENDLGKIVQLPARPEWGLGVISKVQNRLTYIQFQGTEDKAAKKYFRTENPLKLAANQDRSAFKRARVLKKKVRPPKA